jgi:hypothetical protein
MFAQEVRQELGLEDKALQLGRAGALEEKLLAALLELG